MQRKPVGSAAARAGGDAEDGGCPQQQHCFSTCPWPNAACTLPLRSGYCSFPLYAEASEEEAAAFPAGLAVLLSSSGSRRPLPPSDFGTLCSLHGAMNIYFSQGRVPLHPPFNLKYRLFRYIAQALSHDRCKITVKMQRKGVE